MYGFKPPDYAVYRTDDRLMVQFADDRDREAEQRHALARLNPVRGEINGLVDGWRSSRSKKKRCKAECHDRRVGDALVVALEDDVASAETLLDAIKQDIVDDRVATARFWYLTAAFGVGVILGLLIARVADKWTAPRMDLAQAAIAGAAGAFFSIALAIRGRTVLPDLRWVANAMDAALRVVIGLMGGAVLIALVRAGVVNIAFGNTPPGSTNDWLYVLIVGFIAGFSERFVPDLLAKTSGSTDGPPKPPAKATESIQRTSEVQPAEKTRLTAASTPKTVVDPLPEEAAAETCTIGVPLSDEHVTSDVELPPASGGVDKQRAA
jgi:hypothetical protein